MPSLSKLLALPAAASSLLGHAVLGSSGSRGDGLHGLWAREEDKGKQKDIHMVEEDAAEGQHRARQGSAHRSSAKRKHVLMTTSSKDGGSSLGSISSLEVLAKGAVRKAAKDSAMASDVQDEHNKGASKSSVKEVEKGVKDRWEWESCQTALGATYGGGISAPDKEDAQQQCESNCDFDEFCKKCEENCGPKRGYETTECKAAAKAGDAHNPEGIKEYCYTVGCGDRTGMCKTCDLQLWQEEKKCT